MLCSTNQLSIYLDPVTKTGNTPEKLVRQTNYHISRLYSTK